MARLIIKEGGRKRAFRLKAGKFSIGSGDEATLKLSSDGIARRHAVMTYDGERVLLAMEPGVTHATVAGRKYTGEVVLKQGQAVRIAGVSLTLEDDTSPAGGETRSEERKVTSASASGEPAVRRSRHKAHSNSMPSWAIIALGMGAAGAIALAWKSFAEDSTDHDFVARASRVRIEDKLKYSDFRGVLDEIEEAKANQASLTPEWRRFFDEKEVQALQMKAEAETYARNLQGTEVWRNQLEKYQATYLRTNTRPRARVFLRRIEQFTADYPEHPKVEDGWCSRMEERYRGIARLHEPATIEDLEWEVKTLTWARPRDYRTSFRLIEDFLQSASPEDKGRALTLLDEKENERGAYFDDRILQAKYYWDRKQPNKAVAELAQLVAKIGDADMAEDAAQRLLKFDGIDGYLRSYRRDRPSMFTAMMTNASLMEFARNNEVF